MAYIYCITNDINDKVYVGKTEFSIQKRWEEHCSDAFRERNEKRPLYSAMRKYGIEHFQINLIEETNNTEEREIYWIEQKQSYKNGYNATLGGDGKKYINYDDVVNAYYNNNKNITKTAKDLSLDRCHVSLILRSCGIKTLGTGQLNKTLLGKGVNQYTMEGKFIQSFVSAKAAADSLNKTNGTSNGATSHITDVCRGKRKSAYGYIWKFVE